MISTGVLRNARAGIMGGIILGLGRALGETMAVTMVIGNRPEIAKSLFAPGYTMASVIANEFSEATGDTYLSRFGGSGPRTFHRDDHRKYRRPVPGMDGNAWNSSEGQWLIRLAIRQRFRQLRRISLARRCDELPDHLRRRGSRFSGAAAARRDLRLPDLQGIGAINWEFLTQIPKPPGEAGGGMANAIAGISLHLADRQLHRSSHRHRRRNLPG